MPDSLIRSVAEEIIKASGVCTLISLDEDGHPRARAMDPFAPDEQFCIWFGTNPKSRKVEQIKHDSRITVYYFNKETASYVSVYGHAEIITSPEQKKKYWKTGWNNFYPNYPEGYVLIKVIPDWLEIISEAHGITGDPITWTPSSISFDH
jgi:general stress protein 26